MSLHMYSVYTVKLNTVRYMLWEKIKDYISWFLKFLTQLYRVFHNVLRDYKHL